MSAIMKATRLTPGRLKELLEYKTRKHSTLSQFTSSLMRRDQRSAFNKNTTRLNLFVDPSWNVSTRNIMHISIKQRHLHTTSQLSQKEVRCRVELTDEGRILSVIHLDTGKNQRFNATWLRHNCQCEQCKEPHSGQRLIEPAELHPQYTLKHIETDRQNAEHLLVNWQEEKHTGRIPLEYLKKYGYSTQERNDRIQGLIPPVCKGQIPTVAYEKIIASELELWTWVKLLNEYGVTLIKGVPLQDGLVKEVAELIWTVMPTIYGTVFHVVATPEPINIAYSSQKLGLHMDLIYYESPPGIQLLHCKKFDDCVQGGDSILVDAWYAANTLRQLYPEDFEVLTRVPATFQKLHYNRDRPVHMTYQRPHIVVGYNGEVTNVNWAPSFEGPLFVSEEDVEPYYKAYQIYAKLLENSDSKIKIKLEVGDILAFNNRRILHARDSFKLNGGFRHLEGCYLNIDEFKSRVEILAMKYSKENAVKRVFNQSVI